MKRSLAILLALILSLAVFAGCSGTPETPTPTPSALTEVQSSAGTPSPETPTPTTPTPTPSTPTPTPTPEEPFSFTELVPAKGEQKAHKELEELPAFSSLVGSVTLPPIDNQGQIGACQSESVTYMQFTNAVAQYLKNNKKLGSWKPSKDMNSCFSPKFTYQFCGGSTTNVYLFLQDQGTLTYAEDPYVKDAGGGSAYTIRGEFQSESAKWPVSEGKFSSAMGYRISNYEQTFVTNNPLFSVTGKAGVNMTSSEAGQRMLWRIKEAIASGNCVVTGGYPSAWEPGYVRLTSNTGNLGKRGEQVITFSTDNRNGGHNVTIVGYDDELEVTANGITMKGAFLVANSWGTGYGRNGYTWVMYDALNSVSDDPAFTLPKGLGEQKRDWTFDQFCFIYWDSDIIAEMPQLYAEIEVSVASRDSFAIELTRTDKSGQKETFAPSIFAFRTMHENYDVKGYLNPDGIENGPAVDSWFAVNFEPLLKDLPEGATYEDYVFGMNVRAFDDKAQLSVKKIIVKNRSGEVLRSIALQDAEPIAKSETKTFSFALKEKQQVSFLSGKFTLMNAQSGKYVSKSGVVGMTPGSSSGAYKMEITYDKETNTYSFARSDGFVIDFADGAQEGSVPQFNKSAVTREAEQKLHVSYNEDGTVSIFLLGEDGRPYALCERDGKLTVALVTELTPEFCFKAISTSQTYGIAQFSAENGKLTVTGTTLKNITGAFAALLDAEGRIIAEKELTVSSRAYMTVFEGLAAGDYLYKIVDADGALQGNIMLVRV